MANKFEVGDYVEVKKNFYPTWWPEVKGKKFVIGAKYNDDSYGLIDILTGNKLVLTRYAHQGWTKFNVVWLKPVSKFEAEVFRIYQREGATDGEKKL